MMSRDRRRIMYAAAAFHVVVIGAATCIAAEQEGKPAVSSRPVGEMPDGVQVDEYTLDNGRGLQVKLLTYGATITGVSFPDRQGKRANLTLHLDSFEDYLQGHPLFGSLVGRFANRIAGAAFEIEGVNYEVTPNAGKNHIHGGRRGFQKLVWQAKPLREVTRAGVELSHTSPDGHEGYPGELTVRVIYAVTPSNELVMEYYAKTTKPTHVNLTNHAYWNLAGKGDVLDHIMMIRADHFLVPDSMKIPTGEEKSVAGTPMDFRKPIAIGSRIKDVDDQNYDHCYVLNNQDGRLALAARVVDSSSGRVMEVLTTQPGVQLYTAKGLSDRYKAGGIPYGPYYGFCLETQHYPDAPNKPSFPSTLLRPGETYHQTTVYRFGVLD
jgi:aldose 1-epimerase